MNDRPMIVRRWRVSRKDRLIQWAKDLIKAEFSILGVIGGLITIVEVGVLWSVGVWWTDWPFWVLCILIGLGKGIARAQLRNEILKAQD